MLVGTLAFLDLGASCSINISLSLFLSHTHTYAYTNMHKPHSSHTQPGFFPLTTCSVSLPASPPLPLPPLLNFQRVESLLPAPQVHCCGFTSQPLFPETWPDSPVIFPGVKAVQS